MFPPQSSPPSPEDRRAAQLAALLAECEARQVRGHRRYYQPFGPEESAVLREHWRSQLNLPESGRVDLAFRTSAGTVLARGYERIVVGDYGAYLEFQFDQVRMDLLRNRFPGGAPSRAVKYIWKVPVDGSDVKVYVQLGGVTYADYRPGMVYISPSEVEAVPVNLPTDTPSTKATDAFCSDSEFCSCVRP